MIPKEIHQIFFSFNGSKLEDFPLFKDSIKSMKEKNPDFAHRLWSEMDIEHLIKRYHPKHLDFYYNLDYDIMRHDFARMVLLYEFGGFYCDLDNVALKSFLPLTEHKIVLSTIKHIKPKHREFVINDFMGFKPKHPLPLYYLNQCQENYLQKKSIDVYREWKVRFVTQTTGPKFFSRLVKKYYPNYTPMQLAYMDTKDTLQKYWKDDNLELNKEDYYFEEKFAGSWIKSMI